MVHDIERTNDLQFLVVKSCSKFPMVFRFPSFSVRALIRSYNLILPREGNNYYCPARV